MAAVLSLFGWGAANTAEPTPATPPAPADSSSVLVPPALPSLVRTTSTEDEFVIVDEGDQSSSSSNSSVHSRQSSLDESMIDVSKELQQSPSSSSSAVTPAVVVVVEAPIKSPSPTTRACRPYGHAHSPPALLPATVAPSSAAAAPSAAAASPVNTGSPSKRSFAAVAAATSSAAPIKIVAYAQDAEIDLAEQLRMQIALIEAQIAREKATAPVDPLDYAAPLPKSQVRVPLNRDQAIRYTLKSHVDPLAVEEPSSKRAKRTAPSSVTLTKEAAAAKQAKSKAKPHKVARKEEKQMRRERVDKVDAAVVDVSA